MIIGGQAKTRKTVFTQPDGPTVFTRPSVWSGVILPSILQCGNLREWGW
jgi:tRNA G37 N-methylase TrmD